MPPADELSLDVGPAQAAVGLNGKVSQVPVNSVHGSLHPPHCLYCGRPKQDVTKSTVFRIAVRPALNARFSRKFLVLGLLRT